MAFVIKNQVEGPVELGFQSTDHLKNHHFLTMILWVVPPPSNCGK